MLFDKIWILDEGGYPVYAGSVKSAPGYLFKNLNLIYQENVKTDPAQLLDWVNYRLPDKERHVWKRVLSAQQWHDQYMREQALQNSTPATRTLLPARILKIPNLEVQLLIFSIRNFKCKFSRVNEIIKALMVGPLAALVISLLMRTGGANNYTLLGNGNIPLYQFLSTIVAIFLGLVASVDEIIRERNILEKEEYQEFSMFSYLNSKILYLFPVVAIQVILYVITGNLILGIPEMYWVYWIVLFSSSCFGVLLGLAFSAGIRNRGFLYKVVLPLILAVQILLGGGIISFERLNLGDTRYTPIVSDLVVSRWAYEALAVEQFKDNAFERLIYPVDQKLDLAAFYTFVAVPKMEQALTTSLESENSDSVEHNISLLRHELARVATVPDVFRFEYISKLADIKENHEIAQEAIDYVTYLGLHFYEQYQSITRQRSIIMGKLADSLGAQNLARLRQNYHNLALEEAVTNNAVEKPYKIVGNEIVRSSGMIFQEPQSNWGRASFYTPVKQIKAQRTETLWFNISVIWFLTTLCYIWVLFNITGVLREIFHIKKKS
jgi:hypothetical protein